MNLVDKVCILGTWWAVTYIPINTDDEGGLLCGRAEPAKNLITINSNMCKEQQEDTLIHEVFEEILAQINALTDSVKEGREIRLVHNPLTGVDTFTAAISIFTDTLRRSGVL